MIELEEVDDVVLVGGHPRSGTSLACSLVESAGVNFKKEMGSDAYNRGGYYEMKDAKELSSHILKKGMTEENTKRLNKIAKKLKEMEAPRGLKLVHLPAIYYFNQIFNDPKMVFIYRDPREVKSSMFRRGFSEFPIAWAKNNNALLSLYQNYENSIIFSYEDALKKKDTLKDKFQRIGLDVDFSVVERDWRTQETPKLGLSQKEEEVYDILKEMNG
ncbi:MAG: sulfotransferase domain-containing protein [Candidatus Aenigmatarchaeota archaeon]